MATFTADNRDAWNVLFAQVGKDAPRVGRVVKVVKGRKHLGLQGVVVWHGCDTFYFAQHARYMSSAQLALSEARGREGYRVGIQAGNGPVIFVNASYVACVD